MFLESALVGQRKPGAPIWNKMATTQRVDNPMWRDYLPRDKEGNVVLDLPGAVQVALLESPNYQQQLETLYLSGLDVTFERFRFDSQFFGGSSIFHTIEGPVRANKAGGSSELVVSPSDPTNRFRVEKLTATGGELVVGLANSLVWQFAGPDNYTSTTLLDFSFRVNVWMGRDWRWSSQHSDSDLRNCFDMLRLLHRRVSFRRPRR